MANPALDTLFEFLEKFPEVFPASGRIGFPRAEFHPALLKLKQRDIIFQQTFKPAVDELLTYRFATQLDLEGAFDCFLFVPTNQKRESLYWLGRAIDQLKPGGTLIVCGENRRGVKSYRQHVAGLFNEGGVVESWPQNKCVVFWAKKSQTYDKATVASWIQEGNKRQVENSFFHTRIGIYGWNKIDVGSELLVKVLPDLAGKGADFGAGYGYLSYHALKKNPSSLSELHLYEAEKLALDACEENIRPIAGNCRLQFHWANLVSEEPLIDADWVLANPPCHESGKQAPELGHRFIRRAHAALKPGGRMFLVANETIPYESTIDELFQSRSSLVRAKGFKVLEAVK